MGIARLIFINGRIYNYQKYIGSFVYQDIFKMIFNPLVPGYKI